MSDLKTVLTEARTNFQHLENKLQEVRELDRGNSESPTLSRQQFEGYFEEILQIVEMIPENLSLEDRDQWKAEIDRLFMDIEDAKKEMGYSIDQLGAICERSIGQLSLYIESLEPKASTSQPVIAHIDSNDSLNQLLQEGREYLENGDAETCMSLMHRVLLASPNHPEASACLTEAQRRWEDQRLEEELAIHLENLKKDAMSLFDQGKFKECIRLFRFLSEQDPSNHLLQDYLELSRLRLEETTELGPRPSVQEPDMSQSVSSDSSYSQSLQEDASLEEIPANETADAPHLSQDPGPQEEYLEKVPHVSPDVSAESSTIHEVTVAKVSKDALTPLELSEKQELESTALVSREIDSTPVEQQKPKRGWLVLATVGCMLIGALIGASIFHLTRSTPGTLEVQSDPQGASVYIDGKLKGVTPFQASSLQAGEYGLRLEKDGYISVAQTLRVNAGSPTKWSMSLRKNELETTDVADFQKKAQELFEKERYMEANTQCDLILGKDPQNSLASALKGKIAEHYWQEFQSAKQIKYWENARQALENVLTVTPQNNEAIKELNVIKGKFKKKGAAPPAVVPDVRKGRAEELHRQIAVALNTGNYYPPAPGNALDLIQQLTSLSPHDAIAKSAVDRIQSDTLSQMQKKIQSKDYEAARTLARQFQGHFPNNPELSHIQETLRTEESHQIEARNELVQKAEAAMARGNYVTPAGESALAYSNKLLALDRQDSRAQAIRKDSFQKATAQAKEFVQKERFDAARDLLTVLHTVALSEGKPDVAQNLKALLDSIEFTVIPVIHDHTIGSCSGRLRMNAFVIAYLPATDSKDGFSQKLSDILGIEAGDKLKIQMRNKTYRFQASSAKSKEENRQKVREVFDQLNHFMELAHQNSRTTSVAHRTTD